MVRDLRFALRQLVRRRTFSAIAIATIALGIGLSATVFSVVDGVLFRPLPYKNPGGLVAVYGAIRAEDQFTMAVSVPDLMDWRAATRTLQQLEGFENRAGARVYGADGASIAGGNAVSHGFLTMLGVTPILGRGFVDDDFVPSATPVAVVTYRLWQMAFAGEPEILGRRITVGATDHTIVGVLPRHFVFPSNPRFAPDVLIPLLTGSRVTDRASRSLFLIGRLAADATPQQAQTELDAIALRLKPLFVGQPNTHPGAFDGATVRDLRAVLTQTSRGVLWLVFGAVVAVFLISCVNVVGLMVARGEERKAELAIRTAIGAGRFRLVRQLLMEAAVVAAIGAAVGWTLSMVASAAISRQIPRWLQLLGEPRLDQRAFAFAALLALLTVAAGIVPALRASSDAPRAWLASGDRQATGRRRGQHLLVLAEVTLATLLTAAGGLMLRSWINLYSEDRGIDAEHLIAVRTVPVQQADAVARTQHNVRMAAAVRSVKGVSAVAFVDMPLLQRAIKGSGFVPPRRVLHPAGMDTDVRVTPDYFDTVGMKIVSGRRLEPADRGRAVVITQSLARRYWDRANPVGQHIQYRDGTREIVGIVSDARDVSLDKVPVPTLFHVWDERDAPVATIVARFTGAPGQTVGAIRQALRAADERAAITMLATVEDLMALSVAERNFNTMLFTVFAVAALAVTLVGIYGLVAFLVARREREMGLRLALGATGRGLELFVLSGILRWVAAGLVIGIGLSLFLAVYLRPFVYQVAPNDPATLLTVAVGVLVVAAAASYVPAHRVSRVDPMVALRAE
jgi:predicted permease